MKALFLSATIVLAIFTPLIPVIASTSICTTEGVTVVYVNGILTTEDEAKNDKKILEKRFKDLSHQDNVKFIIGYNESHFAGIGDLIKSIEQESSPDVSDYDLAHILIQIHPEVTTKRIFLVGHSQGTFYTNAIYKYLIEHGVARESIAVYNIATPADSVAGFSSSTVENGAYLTSQNDKVINTVRSVSALAHKQPLPANIDIPLSPKDVNDQFGGHAFNEVYLANATERIVSEIASALLKLTTTDLVSSPQANVSVIDGSCFIPPDEGIRYLLKGVAYFVGDPVVGTAVKAGQNIYAVAMEGARATYDIALAAATAVSYALNNTVGSAKEVLTAIISQNAGTGGIANSGLSASMLTVLPNNESQVAENPTAPLELVAADQGSAPITPIATIPQNKNSNFDQSDENATTNSSPQILLTTQTTTTQSQSISTSGGGGGGFVSVGGISESPAPVSQLLVVPVASPPPAQQIPAIQNFQAKFSTTTLNIDISWLLLDPQSTSTTCGEPCRTIFVVKNTTNGSNFTISETSSTSVIFTPADVSFNYSFSVQAFDSLGATSTDVRQATSSISTTTAVVSDYFLNVQPINPDASLGSWYSDNWYQLGTGFYGTVYAITLEGYINDTDFLASHLTLKEFLDSNYTKLNRSFVLSDNAPFTAANQKITITGLTIPLQPNKYYRLDTYQDFQNKSVILKGTTATGTALWDEFIPGTGGVSHTYSFYPFIHMVMTKNYPPISPPLPPTNFSASFDSFNSLLNVNWSSSTDADTLDNLLSYQVNHSTSSVLDSSNWISTSSPTIIPIVFPNTYIFGVMAADDFGNTSTPALLSWSFPDEFAPLPSQLDHSLLLSGGKQQIVITSTTTIDAVAMWLGGTGGTYCCSQSYLRIFTELGDFVAATDDLSLYDGEIRETMYHFLLPVTLSPGQYRLIPTKGPGNTNGTWIFGSPNDAYQGGAWIDGNGNDTGNDAYFKLRSVP